MRTGCTAAPPNPSLAGAAAYCAFRLPPERRWASRRVSILYADFRRPVQGGVNVGGKAVLPHQVVHAGAIAVGLSLACLLFMKRMADVAVVKEWDYVEDTGDGQG